jgi:perosamine synthetase
MYRYMLNLTPSPRNRLHTSLESYLLFLNHALAGRFKQDRTKIEQFEETLVKRFGTQYALCVYQCRLGLYFAVKTLIKPGQEVILSPYTLIDVVNMVIFAGGKPVFADIDRETCNISVTEVERLIGSNTGAVLITHLHGLSAEAHRIKELCDHFQIALIEDAAQSFGTKTESGQPVGTIGDVGVFSFEMHKNLQTWLGGAVVCNRADIAEKIRMELKEFSTPSLPGITQKVKKGLMHDLTMAPVLFQLLTYPITRFAYLNDMEYINSKLRRKPQVSKPAQELPDVYKCHYTSFQANLGLLQLKNIDRDIQTRIDNAKLYYEGLKDIKDLGLPPLRQDISHTYLWFPIQYSQRENLLRFMFERGRDIAAGHFTNTAKLPQFAEFYRDCPNCQTVEQELIYLPTYPRYPRYEIERNIKVIREYFSSHIQTPIKQEVEVSV